MTTDDPAAGAVEPREPAEGEVAHRAAIDAAADRVLRKWHDLLERLRHT